MSLKDFLNEFDPNKEFHKGPSFSIEDWDIFKTGKWYKMTSSKTNKNNYLKITVSNEI
jgi:hypothetical protein